MSDLRNNLNELKRDYESLKYPGDLAADVLEPDRRSVLFRIGPVLAMAAAITVAATVWIMRPDESADSGPVANNSSKDPSPRVPEVSGDDVIGQETIIAAIPEPDAETFASPGWSEVGGASISSVSMPYQSLSMPSLTEIDASITETKQSESATDGSGA